MPPQPALPTDSSNRRIAYLVGAFIVTAAWVMDAGVTGTWPLETLWVRLGWSAILCVCAGLSARSKSIDLTGSLSSMGSVTAMLLLAGLTGGTGSLYFAMVPFLPILIAQVEPERVAATRTAVVTAVIGGAVLIVVEGAGPALLAGWVGCALFLGWWATYWFGRAQQRRAFELATERREAELELERARALQDLATADQRRAQAERLAAVGRIATGVAHEVNNPLAYVCSNLEMIAERARERRDDDLLEMATESVDGVMRIAQIVADLRGFARDSGGDSETLEPDAAIAAAMRLASVQLRKVGRVDLEVMSDLPALRCQKGRLVQVLVNLLANAADAVEGRPDGHVRILASRAGDSILFSVDDNGTGVAPEHAGQVFDPFFSTKHGTGLGIGLALSREFADQLGGSLDLAPSDLGGACFALHLPLARKAA